MGFFCDTVALRERYERFCTLGFLSRLYERRYISVNQKQSVFSGMVIVMGEVFSWPWLKFKTQEEIFRIILRCYLSPVSDARNDVTSKGDVRP
jgi:hypothetical protein